MSELIIERSVMEVREEKKREKEEREFKNEEGERREELRARDLEVLRVCFEQGFLTRRQVISWLGRENKTMKAESARTVCVRTMKRLWNAGLIGKFKIEDQVAERQGIKVTKRGLNLLWKNGAVFSNDSAGYSDSDQIKHAIKVTDIRLAWERLLPWALWCSERYLQDNRNEHCPDAELVFIGGNRMQKMTAAIEVELTQKSESRYEKKFKHYQDSHYDIVFYFTNHIRTTNMIHDVSRGISDIIFVCDIDEFLGRGGEARMASHNDHFQIKERIAYV